MSSKNAMPSWFLSTKFDITSQLMFWNSSFNVMSSPTSFTAGCGVGCHLKRVQKVINFAARIVSGAKHISPVLSALGWPKITDLVPYRDNIRVFRAMKDPLAPAALRTLFTTRAAVSARATRSTLSGALELPNYRLAMSRRAFSYRAAASWNHLPPTTASSGTYTEFFRHAAA